MVRVILNVIWLVLCGVWMSICYVLAGLVCFVLIITIPFGIAAFRIAGYVLWPFGRTIEQNPHAGLASIIGNVLWIILFGWWHRNPARPGQLQDHPDNPAAARGPHRPGGPRLRRSSLGGRSHNGESCSPGDPGRVTAAGPPSHFVIAANTFISGRADLVCLQRQLQARRDAFFWDGERPPVCQRQCVTLVYWCRSFRRGTSPGRACLLSSTWPQTCR